jgi:hypothetical protein
MNSNHLSTRELHRLADLSFNISEPARFEASLELLSIPALKHLREHAQIIIEDQEMIKRAVERRLKELED